MSSGLHLAIVGGGIMGLSVAWAAVRHGHHVTLVEQGPLPHPFASSVDHSRLIRFPYGDKHGYARMVADAYAVNEQLWATLGERLYTETGTLIVVRETDPWAEATKTSLDQLGVAYEIIEGPDLAARYPLLNGDGVEWALVTPTGGVLQARAILLALIGWLRAQSTADLRCHCRAIAVDLDAGRITLAEGKPIDADRVVVACGPWVERLVPDLAAKVTPTRQIALDLEVDRDLGERWAAMPMVLDGVASKGSGFYAVPPVAGVPLKIGDHSFGRHQQPDTDRVARPEEREAVLELLRRGVATPEAYRIKQARTCCYTVSADERFVAQTFAKGTVLTGFSGHGFKFGPLIGQGVVAHAEGRLDDATLQAWLAGDPETRPEALIA
ncbi:MAG: FAD-dependent oxidoreductase [Geminicoccaceae bacterium]|nr:MAG: FAD-dependent oxidoreductase [Geminicoccaceae bacterium]